MINWAFTPWYIIILLFAVGVFAHVLNCICDACERRERRKTRSNRRGYVTDPEDGCRPNIPTLATPPPAYSPPARKKDVPAPPYNPGTPPMYHAQSQV